MSKKADKRRIEIAQTVQSEGEANVADMAKMFGVTTETIRADFDYLASQNGWLRTHGGLQEKEDGKYKQNYLFHERQVIHMEDKKKLCYGVMDLISDGDCIYIDSGSTVIYLLNYLNQKKSLTIVTHSIGFLMKYIVNDYEKMFKEQGHRFLFIGGEVEGNIMMTYGSFFEQTATELIYDHLIFSVDAIDLDFGGTNVDYQAYTTVKSVIKYARNKILLVDSSKFDLSATYKVIGLEQINYMITNKAINEQWKSILEQKHVPYLMV